MGNKLKMQKVRNTMKKKALCAITVLLACMLSAPTYAQTAAELEDILRAQTVTYAQAASFVLEAAEVTNPQNTAQAFAISAERAWVSKKASAEKHITLAELSFLIMKAFDMKGGIMYAVMPGPRYAYRSTISRSFIQGDTDPDMTVSGDRFLLILGNVLNASGGGL
jgi:hypothetical protein